MGVRVWVRANLVAVLGAVLVVQLQQRRSPCVHPPVPLCRRRHRSGARVRPGATRSLNTAARLLLLPLLLLLLALGEHSGADSGLRRLLV